MRGSNPWRVEAIQFVQAARHQRAATYRGRATALSDMAASEIDRQFKKQLFDLAEQYAELAEELEQARS